MYHEKDEYILKQMKKLIEKWESISLEDDKYDQNNKKTT
jgi:hypothetical protein